MSDSKLRGGKNLRRKWENTIIVTLKITAFAVSFLCLSSWFSPYSSFPASSFPKCPMGFSPTGLWGVFRAVPSFSQYKHIFSHLSHIRATWLLVPCECNPGLLAPQSWLSVGSTGAAWAAVASRWGQGCEVRKGLHSHQYLHACA